MSACDIRLCDVWKQFEGSPSPTLAGINLEVHPKKIHYLLGPSGCGKSVTVKLILGLLRADKGVIEVKGRSLGELDSHSMREVRTHFGMLFQNSALFDGMDVFENVAFPLREHRRGMSESRMSERVRELLEMVELDLAIRKMPSELSGGMRKRVGLARALALDPDILLFDEPTTGLDPVTSQTIDALIERTIRSQGASALIISHNIRAAIEMADFVSMISEAKIIASSTAHDFRNNDHPKVQQFMKSAGLL